MVQAAVQDGSASEQAGCEQGVAGRRLVALGLLPVALTAALWMAAALVAVGAMGDYVTVPRLIAMFLALGFGLEVELTVGAHGALTFAALPLAPLLIIGAGLGLLPRGARGPETISSWLALPVTAMCGWLLVAGLLTLGAGPFDARLGAGRLDLAVQPLHAVVAGPIVWVVARAVRHRLVRWFLVPVCAGALVLALAGVATAGSQGLPTGFAAGVTSALGLNLLLPLVLLPLGGQIVDGPSVTGFTELGFELPILWPVPILLLATWYWWVRRWPVPSTRAVAHGRIGRFAAALVFGLAVTITAGGATVTATGGAVAGLRDAAFPLFSTTDVASRTEPLRAAALVALLLATAWVTWFAQARAAGMAWTQRTRSAPVRSPGPAPGAGSAPGVYAAPLPPQLPPAAAPPPPAAAPPPAAVAPPPAAVAPPPFPAVACCTGCGTPTTGRFCRRCGAPTPPADEPGRAVASPLPPVHGAARPPAPGHPHGMPDGGAAR